MVFIGNNLDTFSFMIEQTLRVKVERRTYLEEKMDFFLMQDMILIRFLGYASLHPGYIG